MAEKRLSDVLLDYKDKFDSYPEVTTMHINEAGSQHLMKVCVEAIANNKALTKGEMLKIEQKYNAHLYEEGVFVVT